MALKKKAKAVKKPVKKTVKKTVKKAPKKTVKKPAKKRVKKTTKVAKPGRKTVKRGGKKKATTRGRKKKTVKKKLSKKKKTRTVRKTRKTKKEQADEGVAESVTPRPSETSITFKTHPETKAIKDFLKNKKITFEIVKHSPAFTAQQIAASAHVPGKNIAKTVIVKIDGKMAIIVEPAHLKVNLDAVRRQLNAERVELASEAEFRNKFQNCELGAMPPLGNLYNMDVYVSDNLSHDEFILFNAGTHSELIKMLYKDFYNLVKPKIIYA